MPAHHPLPVPEVQHVQPGLVDVDNYFPLVNEPQHLLGVILTDDQRPLRVALELDGPDASIFHV
jgi:hypothetical protein